MTKTLIVYAGLHKTGSTAAQVALADLRGPLAERGVLLHSPDGKRVTHHRHASVIADESRFTSNALLFARLAEDIRAFDGHTAVISSEDFESALGDPDALGRLRGFCDAAGLDPAVLVYLRNPIGYFESLYLQMLRHGMTTSASDVAAEVLAEGRFTWRKWTFHFDYSAIANALATAGIRATFRDYHALAHGSTPADVLVTLGCADLVGQLPAETRVNVRKTGRKLLRFLRSRRGAEAPQKKWLRRFDKILAEAPPRLSGAVRERFQERFRASTEEIDQAHGLGLTQAMLAAPRPGSATRLEAVFSDATDDRLMRLFQDYPDSPDPAHLEELANAWSDC